MSFTTFADIYDRINGNAYKPYAEMLMSDFQKADIKDYLVVGTVLGLIAVVADVIVIFLNIAEVGIFDMFTNTIEDVNKLF